MADEKRDFFFATLDVHLMYGEPPDEAMVRTVADYAEVFHPDRKIRRRSDPAKPEVEIVPLTGRCGSCAYWVRKMMPQGDAARFGICTHPGTYSWVRGDSFEPPENFGCVNFKTEQEVWSMLIPISPLSDEEWAELDKRFGHKLKIIREAGGNDAA